ncbi:hypothetical protein GF337_19960 [candidate division KSB1 bacterium]|nr:hypothetical protein [candidate division KSB1 bacterium]
MKNFIIKYANLTLILFLLLFRLKTRAKILWLLFTIKQNVLGFSKSNEDANG